ncbi:antibiotic biosynthesis monooxygenase [Saccharothrix saharensis]|uniref:Antibiotic biosynthesis monooxygenase n=1 Tax=Saccharothrix saharensis TaxID=571190 RepID=A0A543J5C5_9PSEU|nr:antibiotic biosynthesis monooxygenase [Saccharothrix saharensis]TQM78033.1 antibiotic biosynthesis monooxygenase [Saccharothrix saharensis]
MELTRPDADHVLVHRGRVPFDPRPDGLLDARWLREVDGDGVVTYSQWSRPVDADGAVDGDGAVAYRRYRSVGRASADRPVGCVVLVSVRFDRSGVAEEWVDLVLAALAAEDEPDPGGISAHFHVGVDGTRVLNYAEWTSARAHVDAMARGDGAVGRSPLWRRVRSFPGLASSDVRRYRVVGG